MLTLGQAAAQVSLDIKNKSVDRRTEIRDLESPMDLAHHIEANLEGEERLRIKHELRLGLASFAQNSPDFGGGHFGSALHMLLVGPWVMPSTGPTTSSMPSTGPTTTWFVGLV